METKEKGKRKFLISLIWQCLWVYNIFGDSVEIPVYIQFIITITDEIHF